MTNLEEVLETIGKMDGVIQVFVVNGEILDLLREIESNIKASLDLDVKNIGIEECLKRGNILCIIKDGRFRPPPEPTVLLVGDEDLVMGKEIIPSDHTNYGEDENAILLSEDFVIFKDKKPKDREFFIMPPVSFPELEVMEGVLNVVSCSPSPLGDLALRRTHGLKDDPKLASILVGFDLVGFHD